MESFIAWVRLTALIVTVVADSRYGNSVSFTRDRRTHQGGGHLVRNSWRNQELPEQVFMQNAPSNQETFASRLELQDDKTALPPAALAGRSIGRLATGMMNEIYKERGAAVNNVASPLSLWMVLMMALEAAGGDTASQLLELLGSKDNRAAIKAAYRSLDAYLPGSTSQNQMKTMMLIKNFIARDRNVNITAELNQALKKDFNVQNFVVDASEAERSANEINQWTAKVTKQRIKEIIVPSDFDGLKFLFGNAVLFKGRWKFPFNASATFTDQFKNESEKILGDILMMTARLVLKYAYSDRFDSQVIEIPYADDRTSMVVFLPRRKVLLSDVLNRFKGNSLAEIMPEVMSDEEVDLYLPKFTVATDITLNKVLYELGAKDMLNQQPANFPGFSDGGYISRVLQKAEIENDEEGSTASAVSSAQVSYKTSSVTFHANRPFIYFINDIKTRTVLFVGTISNPNAI